MNKGCDQCEAAMINGVFCHERGCPNAGSRWSEATGEWVRQRECRECGCTVAEDDLCCQEPVDFGEDEAPF